MNTQLISNATGTRDLVGLDVQIRQKIISILRSTFESMDAIELDTPIIELKTLVDQMYGEEFNKLVYELVDYKEVDEDIPRKQMLRYDLTVPLARYCAMNGIKALRRYQIGKVYRRDKPNIQNGRYREFYQCDFDIVGDDIGSGINDIEILDLMVRVLDRLLGRGTYKIKINNKKILVDILTGIGIDISKLSTICSSIDKLDKCSWDDLMPELESKGVTNEQISQLKSLLNLSDGAGTILDKLSVYSDNKTIESMKKMFNILNMLGIMDAFVFDLSLARGMDYYTGIIYEAVYLDKSVMSSSIAAGGRYDKMIGKLGNYGDIPAIGLSIGLERIVRIIEQTNQNFCTEKNPTIFVASIGSSEKVITERIKLCSELRSMGFIVAMSNKSNPKMAAQFEVVFNKKIKYMIIIGDREIDAGQLKIKDITTKVETTFSRSDGLEFLINSC
ncbi:histidine tRNA synthetase [Tupanvirus deep ocean]|uniref:Histidine tRNA synthetase n=2 Tax=Tupanvirus TaxID=2094720 RepID=A0AC62A8E8_9VIRU|nr:histidine tRNA synthetase [Tupanvirus deep ocean]QKU33928.1 histidine tRNA synthetase [Tupanvirus deep ocean]